MGTVIRTVVSLTHPGVPDTIYSRDRPKEIYELMQHDVATSEPNVGTTSRVSPIATRSRNLPTSTEAGRELSSEETFTVRRTTSSKPFHNQLEQGTALTLTYGQ